MKTLKYFFLAALTVFALAACKKGDENKPADGGNGGDNGGNGGTPEFVAAVNIDGEFDDWKEVPNKLELEGGPVYVFKATYDEKYVYFYIKRNLVEELFPTVGNGYFYFCMETDENPETGIKVGTGEENKVNGQWLVPEYGIDSWFFAYLYADGQKVKQTTSEVRLSGDSYPEAFINNVESAGKVSVAQETIEIEVRANREDMKIETGKTVKIHTWGNKSATNFQKTPLSFKIEK